ncbi:MAG: thiamine phosphate synthase [Methylococcaceae bacterium]|nr:thiamine phosphate synthase [Methylococcaceae bacterium]
MKLFPKRGLYAITQCDNKSSETIIEEVKAAIRGGAVVIQYRDKSLVDAVYVATELAKICRINKIPLLINDDIALCIQSNADGVHLGKDDHDINEARKHLGDTAIIGVSCYNSLERAVKAQDLGASYVAFGRFFPSSSKPLASPASIDTLKKAKPTIKIPIVAIGGILPENGGQLIQAGADLLAVIGGVFNDNPEQSARSYQPLFIDK